MNQSQGIWFSVITTHDQGAEADLAKHPKTQCVEAPLGQVWRGIKLSGWGTQREVAGVRNQHSLERREACWFQRISSFLVGCQLC